MGTGGECYALVASSVHNTLKDLSKLDDQMEQPCDHLEQVVSLLAV